MAKGNSSADLNFVTMTSIFIISFIVVYTNILLDISYISIMIYLLGAVFYLVFIKISDVHFKYSCDYIQSGEGSACLLILMLSLRFLTDNIVSIFLATSMVMLLVGIFINKITVKNSSDNFNNGLLMNLIFAVFVIYFYNMDNYFNAELLTDISLGYLNTIKPSPLFLGCVTIFIPVILMIYKKIKPELVLYSHGKNYFKISGLNFNRTGSLTIAARSIVFSFTILLIGMAGGIGQYIKTAGRGRLHFVEISLIVVIYTQAILMMTIITNKITVILIAISISYLFYYILYRKNSYMYDRNKQS